MKISVGLKQKFSLPLVLGLCDGIITVLILITNRLVKSNEAISFIFAIKIALVAGITGVFVYFVSYYTEFRRQLLHTECELNLTSSGRLAMTNLGKQIMVESITLMLIASFAAFIGSFIPVIVAIIFQKYKWASILSATLTLGILGIFLAKLVYGSKLRWALGLIMSGLLISYVGMKLNIVGCSNKISVFSNLFATCSTGICKKGCHCIWVQKLVRTLQSLRCFIGS